MYNIQSKAVLPKTKNKSAKWFIIFFVIFLSIIIFIILAFTSWQKKVNNIVLFTNNFIKKAAKNIDSDRDQLFDYEETLYETDPEKQDTDGDGYSDYSEIVNGYNPLGDGNIDKTILLNNLSKIKSALPKMRNLMIDRTYVDNIKGYSFILPASWQFKESKDNKAQFILMKKEKLVGTVNILKFDYEKMNEYFNVSLPEDFKISEMGDIFEKIYSKGQSGFQRKIYEMNNGSGYEFISPDNDKMYILKVVSQKVVDNKKSENNEQVDILKIDIEFNEDATVDDIALADKIVNTFSNYSNIEIDSKKSYSSEGNTIPSVNVCLGVEETLQYDNCFFDLAKRFSENMYCDFIWSLDLYNECHKVARNPELACEDTTSAKKDCYYNLAGVKLNFEYCKKLDLKMQNECYAMIAKKTGEEKYCEMISIPYYKETYNNCYYDIAVYENNLNFLFCNKILNDSDKLLCFQDLVIKTSNVSICSNLESDNVTNIYDCYAFAAKAYGNLGICTQILDKNGEAYCIEVVNK